MSVTTTVFGEPPGSPGYYWVYYTITKSQDVPNIVLAPTQNYPVVLMFWASWNEPCKIMMKPFRDMAMAKRKEAAFSRVDVDKCKDIAAQFGVEALPTFLLIKGGKEKCRVVGAKVDLLNSTIKANI